MTTFKCASGFHLLELIAALALCGLLALISLPQISDLSASAALRAETRRVTSLLAQTGSRAQASAKTLQVLTSLHQLSVFNDEMLRSYPVPEPVSIEAGQQLTFYATGTATPATLTLRQHEKSCRVVVSLQGRARWSCP